MKKQIGVAITVHNRFEETNHTVKQWKKFLPSGTPLVIVDDGSDEPCPDATFRFEKPVGIARAKNKCLELLEDLNVTDFFLSDNDLFPVHKDWYKPYISSPEAHLSYQFPDLIGPVKLHDIIELYRDSTHVAYSGQRGCLLYYTLDVLEKVGGFDPIYGRALYEHTDLANRIHAEGLTTWRYADIVESNKYWYSLDEHRQVSRTISPQELETLVHRNANIHNTRMLAGFRGYVPYREENSTGEKIIITTLLTANKDPQRGIKWPAIPEAISPWLESIERGGWSGVVLADELTQKSLRGYTSKVVNVESSKMNVYYQRWLHIYQYLREHDEVEWVWCTDGSDVEVLRDPFDGMQKGKLYAGYENKSVGDSWMRQNHPAEVLQNFIKRNSSLQLLNAGVVGGDRETIMKLALRIVDEYNDTQCARFWGKDRTKQLSELGDMAAFNKAAYDLFTGNLITGPEIVTEFKKNSDNGIAKFKHK